jgi:hypothetical protein
VARTLDDELKSALFHSAIVHFARPFYKQRHYGGRISRTEWDSMRNCMST